MLARGLGLVAILLAAACAPAAGARGVEARGARAPGPRPAGRAAPAAAQRGARYFQGIPEEAFWVSHDDRRDRVVSGGARLELAPDGRITAAAW
ncbi:MAG: hypothetical protein IT372_17605, partial [Polyangiaceae bacterium]|nr:hypothetical protein [Polyangiaceae bacterium]